MPEVASATTGAQRAAATRRIKRRAAQWRAETRPDFDPVKAETELAEHLAALTRPNAFGRPPLSAEAILWRQFAGLCELSGQVASRRLRIPSRIGGLRKRRKGMAALLTALDGVTVAPQETCCGVIDRGDMILHNGRLVRSEGHTSDAASYTFNLEGGGKLRVEGDTLPAIRPADFDLFNDEWRARESAKHADEQERRKMAYDAFGDAYKPAAEARDWPAVRAAIAAFKVASLDFQEARRMRELVKCRIAMILETPPGTRELARRRYRHPDARHRGFACYMAREASARARLARIAAIPGFDPADRRALVKAKDIHGRELRLSGEDLRAFDWRRGEWLAKCNAAGVATRRTGSTSIDYVKEIIPAKRKGIIYLTPEIRSGSDLLTARR